MLEVLSVGAATLFMVSVAGHPLVCLWDTGANVSLVSLALVKRLRLEDKIEPLGHPVSIKGITKELTETLGKIAFHVQFEDGVPRKVVCLVCENVPHGLLLGTPFMSANRLLFDPGHSPANMTLKDKHHRVVARPPDSLSAPTACFTKMTPSLSASQPRTTASASPRLNHPTTALDPLLARAFQAKLKTDDPSQLLATLLKSGGFMVDRAAHDLLQCCAAEPHSPDSATVIPGISTSPPDCDAPKESAPAPDSEKWDLSPTLQKALDDLLLEYDDIFASDNSDVGKAARGDVVIKLTSKAPIVQRNYRTPLKFRDWLKQELRDLLQAGVIEISDSEYNSPALVVPKKLDDNAAATDVTASKGLRLVIDYRQVNKILEDANFPIPRVQDMITQYQGKDTFSVMDVRHAFYTIRIDKASRKVTAFSCEFGKFQFCFLPQGLKISPAIFQQTITNVLANLDHSSAYMDDITTATTGQEPHLTALRELFHAIRTSGFKLKKGKCLFFRKTVSTLGWVLSDKGVAIAPDKLQDVEKLRPPQTVGEVRSLLGFVNFLRDHVAHFADIVAPIQDLVRKGKGQSNTSITAFWDQPCENALAELKRALLSNTVLAYPDSALPFDLFTDASGRHMSGVLMQNNRPIGYFAKSFKGTEANWAALVKEAHAVYRAVEFFSVFITGAKVRLRCDHQPLKQFLHASTKNSMVNRWSLNLQQYDIDFEWVATDANISDCLSRLIEDKIYVPHEPVTDTFPEKGQVVVQACPIQVKAFDFHEPLSAVDMAALQRNDAYCNRIRRQLGTDHSLAEKFYLRNDILYRLVEHVGSFSLALVLPRSLILTAIVNVHLELIHPGQDKTLAMLRQKVYWRGMQKDVARYIAGCRPCQMRNAASHSYSYLHSQPPATPFMDLAVDLVKGYGLSKQGNLAVLTSICLHSQYPFAIPIPDQTAESTVRAFTQVLATANSCVSVLSDNGPEFTSHAFKELLASHSIQHRTTAPYSPQSNGIMERWHRYLNAVVRLCGIHRESNQWEDAVLAAVKAYRVMPHTASGQSPHFLCFAKDPKLNLDHFLPILQRNFRDKNQAQRAMEHLRLAFGLARKNICLARRRHLNPSTKEPPRPIKVGDLVIVRQNAARKGQPPWQDGYRVIKFISTRQLQVEHTETGHKLRVALSHVRRTEPLAVLLENSRLDVFPGKSKLYLPAPQLPFLDWPAIESDVDMDLNTVQKLYEATRDRTFDFNEQAAPAPAASSTHPTPPDDAPSSPVKPRFKLSRKQEQAFRRQAQQLSRKRRRVLQRQERKRNVPPSSSPVASETPNQTPSPPVKTRSGRTIRTPQHRDFVYVSRAVLEAQPCLPLAVSAFHVHIVL